MECMFRAEFKRLLSSLCKSIPRITWPHILHYSETGLLTYISGIEHSLLHNTILLYYQEWQRLWPLQPNTMTTQREISYLFICMVSQIKCMVNSKHPIFVCWGKVFFHRVTFFRGGGTFLTFLNLKRKFFIAKIWIKYIIHTECRKMVKMTLKYRYGVYCIKMPPNYPKNCKI